MKKYIWCMVNKEAKIAVYFYDDGSRGRQVLRDFLDKNEIDALQSDGFNVYMYLDKELVDVDHLCCLAHARAKFKYALEQGKDEEAEYFIRNIGRLYDLEEQYRLRHLTPEQIQLSSFYHTFIETCKMCGVSTLEYFKEFFKAIMQGRTDYERSALPLATIGTQEYVTDDHRY